MILFIVCCILNSVLSADSTDVQCNKNIDDMIYINKDKQRPMQCDVEGIGPCVLKCCGEDQIFVEENHSITCTNATLIYPEVTINYSSINVYYKNVTTGIPEVSKTRTYGDFHKFYNKDFVTSDCSSTVKMFINASSYLLEDGSLSINEYDPFLPLQFCVDLLVVKENETYHPPTTTFNFYSDDSEENCDEFTQIVIIISIVFLAMTILVQCVLRQYHKMVDKLILTYIGMLLLAFLLKTIMNGLKQTIIGYVPAVLSCVFFYYFYLSSFFWINISSLDIWWSLRGARLQRHIHNMGINSKYRRYGLYAWGVPLLITAFVVMVENDVIPNVTKPMLENCFIEGDAARYFYVPLGILTALNMALFVMTLYNIWLVQYAPEIRNSSNTKVQKNRFNKFTKLSTMMGLSWILEVIQAFILNECNIYFYIINIYNGLIGVVIFFIFACNKSNYKQFCRRFNIKSKYIVSQPPSSMMSNVSSQKSDSIKVIKHERSSGVTDSSGHTPTTTSTLLNGYSDGASYYH